MNANPYLADRIVKQKKMKIEIWSDVMCPFCYVGKKHFEAALSKVSLNSKVEVEWKSFQLDPDLPKEGAAISTKEYLMNRKGMPEEQIQGMFEHLQHVGKNAGIDFKQEASIPVNTFLAHRFIHFAQKQGKGNEAEENLFKAHFTEGKNVGNIEVLKDIAVQIGLNGEETESFLLTDKETEAVLADIKEAQTLGISGVPFFVIDRKYGISGAQPIEVFVETLQKVDLENTPKFEMNGNKDAGACGADGCEL